jgi:hypothetical protein
MSFEHIEVAQMYIRLWRRVIVDFLGRSESELDELIETWRDGLSDENSLFYHEPPEYYVAPKLLPPAAKDSSPIHRTRLCWAIYRVIGRYAREHGLEPTCFNAMREELDRTISKAVSSS